MAYRSRPRPSSTPGAKASTVCPSYLDGDRPPLREAGDTQLFGQLCSFQGPTRRAPRGLRGVVSQNSTACRAAGGAGLPRELARVALGPVDIPRTAGARGAWRALRQELPRKEVIQPHLPVRLPCYDFTPITSPTFDGSLPCGLGHRLRVLPAFVV